jgi:hypothetical protein
MSEDTELPLTFADAEMGFIIWLYNLWITYPDEEIYLADDDVSGAFQWTKYHPHCMGLHTSLQCGYCVFNSSSTFGDNTSPSNFDPIVMGHWGLAHHHWLANQDAIG